MWRNIIFACHIIQNVISMIFRQNVVTFGSETLRQAFLYSRSSEAIFCLIS